MTQHLFSLTAHPELPSRAREVFDTAPDAPVEVLREKVRAVASTYVDTIVDGMILAFIAPADEGTRSAGLVRNLAGLIKTVSHGLVKSATGSAKRPELEKVIAYVRAQLVLDTARPAVEFPLAPVTRDGFSAVIAARHAGRIEAERPLLMNTMLAFVDEALAQYLLGPFALFDLGFMTRKAFDVGHSSIRAGARTAIQFSLGADGDSDVTHLVDFFDRTIVRPS